MKIKVNKEKNPLKFEEVQAREALVEDMIEASRVSGETEGPSFNCALIASVCEFDGKKLSFEDIQKMPSGDFLELQLELTNQGALGSQEQLLSLLEKLDSQSKESKK